MHEGSCWREYIKSTLVRIGDEAYQRAAWFNRHHEASSPDELINQLYDDFGFDRFIDDKGVGLSPRLRSQCRELSDLLRKFCEQTPTALSPFEVIDDDRWAHIRNSAAIIATQL